MLCHPRTIASLTILDTHTGLLPTCFRMFSGILCSGTWPGPSFITCRHGSHTVTVQVINRLYVQVINRLYSSASALHEHHPKTTTTSTEMPSVWIPWQVQHWVTLAAAEHRGRAPAHPSPRHGE